MSLAHSFPDDTLLTPELRQMKNNAIPLCAQGRRSPVEHRLKTTYCHCLCWDEQAKTHQLLEMDYAFKVNMLASHPV